MTLEQAEALLAEPPAAPRPSCRARAPLKELGTDPSNGRPIVLRDGSFGPYVTDEETNASFRRGDDAEGMTLERARNCSQKDALRASKGHRWGVFGVRRRVHDLTTRRPERLREKREPTGSFRSRREPQTRR